MPSINPPSAIQNSWHLLFFADRDDGSLGVVTGEVYKSRRNTDNVGRDTVHSSI